jgi:hypothetical protein
MVAFITQDDNNNPEIPPPYDFPGITIFSFRLPAKLTRLQSLCDKWLNIGTLAKRGFEYRAFFNFVDMEIVTYPKMMFTQAPYSNWGYATQQELYFRFFVWRLDYVCGFLLPAPLPELFFPFMFVDNSWSMISGRNVIGFPKVIAQFSPASVSNANPFPITASALVLEKHTPTTQLDWSPIVIVKKGPANMSPQTNPGGKWPWIALGAPIADLALQQSFQGVLAQIPNIFSTVQLKQFRDAASLTDACYQAVVATPFTPSGIGAPSLLPPVTITVNKYASLDIPGAFGFQPGKALRPSLHYSVGLNMSMGNATNLFVNS